MNLPFSLSSKTFTLSLQLLQQRWPCSTTKPPSPFKTCNLHSSASSSILCKMLQSWIRIKRNFTAQHIHQSSFTFNWFSISIIIFICKLFVIASFSITVQQYHHLHHCSTFININFTLHTAPSCIFIDPSLARFFNIIFIFIFSIFSSSSVNHSSSTTTSASLRNDRHCLLQIHHTTVLASPHQDLKNITTVTQMK